MLAFQAFGDPVGEPRAQPSRAGGKLRMHRNSMADPWKRAVRAAALEALGRVPSSPVFPPRAPVLVTLEFRLRRPAAHHVARDRARPLRKGAPAWPTPKPDIDNLAKAVLDALGQWPRGARPILWADDQQVTALWARKSYATTEAPPGVSVEVAIPRQKEALEYEETEGRPCRSSCVRGRTRA
jgi:Holliday junction resolvase RusA-like endonuclease